MYSGGTACIYLVKPNHTYFQLNVPSLQYQRTRRGGHGAAEEDSAFLTVWGPHMVCRFHKKNSYHVATLLGPLREPWEGPTRLGDPRDLGFISSVIWVPGS